MSECGSTDPRAAVREGGEEEAGEATAREPLELTDEMRQNLAATLEALLIPDRLHPTLLAVLSLAAHPLLQFGSLPLGHGTKLKL